MNGGSGFLCRVRLPAIIVAIPSVLLVAGQPLIDLAAANALVSEGLDRQEMSATLPLRLDTLGHLLVIDPYFVQWHARTDGAAYTPARNGPIEETMQGVGGALTGVLPLGTRWKLALAGIARYHWLGRQEHGDMQPGGALLLSRAVKPALTLRAGCYVNHDAFGWFIMPLAGIDWRVDPKTNLYGVLPGALTFERKTRHWFNWGLSFRAYTTSFGVRGGDYRRINENPLGIYMDHRLTKQLVLRTEAGWCILRQVLGGPGDALAANPEALRKGYADHRIADGPYARLLLAYRLRLD